MTSLRSLFLPGEILESKIPLETPIELLTDRSDAVAPGACFVAVAGLRTDGHLFIDDAVRRGTAAIVVDRRDAFERCPNTILVRSTRELLGVLASRWYEEPSRKFKLVGVTGTNGKTTTAFLLKNVWDALEMKNGLVGTVEYHIGAKRFPSALTTPDPLLLQQLFAQMVEEKVGHVALEVSSIALDQNRIGGSHFEVAVFTNLTRDHLDYHGDMDRYFEAKRKLFSDYRPRFSIFNTDDPYALRLFEEHEDERFSFALDRKADFSAVDISYDRSGTHATLQTPAGRFAFRSVLIGKHNLYNCLGALAAGVALGQDTAATIEALSAASGAPGRLERVPGKPGRHPHVFVDYAHSDDALRNVLSSIRELKGTAPGKIFTVFGCGGDRDRTKRPLMARVVSELSDVTIATSDNPRTEDPQGILDDIETGILKAETEYHRQVDRAMAIQLALELAGPQDLVLVAGKGHETYQIQGRDRVPFDDREVVRSYFAAH